MQKKEVIKIKELIQNNKISLRELSRLSRIRHATLSELQNNKTKYINLNHIERVAEALTIQDIREIIDLHFYYPDLDEIEQDH